MYKVIATFKDTDGIIYKPGSSYPAKKAKKPTAARLKTLSTVENKYSKQFIEKVATKDDGEA